MTPFTLEDFVRESNRIEGIPRVTEKQINAHYRLLRRPSLDVQALQLFVLDIAPGKPLRLQAGMNVRVGNHVAPAGGPEIGEHLANLLERTHYLRFDPAATFLIHQEYETLHPFMDGNGRSGRALWLWMMGGIERAPLGFLHTYYYQSLAHQRPASQVAA